MATQQFIDHHTWATTHPHGERRDHGYGTRYWVQQQQLALMGVPYAPTGEPRPLNAGPGNRNCTRDEARRHLSWLQNMAFLRTLAADRAFK